MGRNHGGNNLPQTTPKMAHMPRSSLWLALRRGKGKLLKRQLSRAKWPPPERLKSESRTLRKPYQRSKELRHTKARGPKDKFDVLAARIVARRRRQPAPGKQPRQD